MIFLLYTSGSTLHYIDPVVPVVSDGQIDLVKAANAEIGLMYRF